VMISLSPTAPESTATAVVVFPAAAAALVTIHHSLDGGIHTHTMTHRRRPRPASASVMVVLLYRTRRLAALSHRALANDVRPHPSDHHSRRLRRPYRLSLVLSLASRARATRIDSPSARAAYLRARARPSARSTTRRARDARLVARGRGRDGEKCPTRTRARALRARSRRRDDDGRIDCAATRAGDEETHPRVRMRIISSNRKSMDPVV
jgi:hypothetical protein